MAAVAPKSEASNIGDSYVFVAPAPSKARCDDDFEEVNIPDLNPIIQKVKGLLEKLTASDHEKVAEYGEFLLDLRLQNCCLHEAKYIDAFVHSFPNVVKLTLVNCNLTDSCFDSIARFHALEELNVSSHKSSMSVALKKLRPLKKLRVIDISECGSLTDDDIAELIKSVPTLEKIILNGCLNLTEKTLTILRAHKPLKLLSVVGSKIIPSHTDLSFFKDATLKF